MLQDFIATDLTLFLNHTRYGNFIDIRTLAFDALLLLDGLSIPAVLEYFLYTICNDQSTRIKHYVSQILLDTANATCGIVAEQDFNHKDRGGSGLRLYTGILSRNENVYSVWEDVKNLICNESRIEDLLVKCVEYFYFNF